VSDADRIAQLENTVAVLATLRDAVHSIAVDKSLDADVRLEQIASLTDKDANG
jgi:hypothetical protein